MTLKSFWLSIKTHINRRQKWSSLNVLQRNSSTDFNIENPIFVIDPYGRAVMYFDSKTDPKLIKDLKVHRFGICMAFVVIALEHGLGL